MPHRQRASLLKRTISGFKGDFRRHLVIRPEGWSETIAKWTTRRQKNLFFCLTTVSCLLGYFPFLVSWWTAVDWSSPCYLEYLWSVTCPSPLHTRSQICKYVHHFCVIGCLLLIIIVVVIIRTAFDFSFGLSRTAVCFSKLFFSLNCW